MTTPIPGASNRQKLKTVNWVSPCAVQVWARQNLSATRLPDPRRHFSRLSASASVGWWVGWLAGWLDGWMAGWWIIQATWFECTGESIIDLSFITHDPRSERSRISDMGRHS
jgi:hypothetical protein